LANSQGRRFESSYRRLVGAGIELSRLSLSTCKGKDARIKGLLVRKAGVKMSGLRDKLKKTIFEYFGVFREGKKMVKGLEKLLELKSSCPEVYINNKYGLFNYVLIYTLKLEDYSILQKLLQEELLLSRKAGVPLEG